MDPNPFISCVYVYMLCAKYGLGQSPDCPAQTLYPSIVQQSSNLLKLCQQTIGGVSFKESCANLD